MKSFSKSRVLLDIPPINVRLILPQLFMSRMKNKLAALAVLLGIELLSLSLFTSGTSWSNQHTLAGAQIDASAVRLGCPAKTDSGLVFGSYRTDTVVGSFFDRETKTRNLRPKLCRQSGFSPDHFSS